MSPDTRRNIAGDEPVYGPAVAHGLIQTPTVTEELPPYVYTLPPELHGIDMNGNHVTLGEVMK